MAKRIRTFQLHLQLQIRCCLHGIFSFALFCYVFGVIVTNNNNSQRHNKNHKKLFTVHSFDFARISLSLYHNRILQIPWMNDIYRLLVFKEHESSGCSRIWRILLNLDASKLICCTSLCFIYSIIDINLNAVMFKTFYIFSSEYFCSAARCNHFKFNHVFASQFFNF